ncbi:MAG: hypothetical protein ABIM99_03855 [Candidatus Dojkabacteria bacterium]
MSEVLSIRNQAHLENYPGFIKIREAVVYAFDVIAEFDEEGQNKVYFRAKEIIETLADKKTYHKVLDLLINERFSIRDLNILLKANSIFNLKDEEEVEMAIEILTLHMSVSSYCEEVSILIKQYLKASDGFSGDVYIIKSEGDTRYFSVHNANIIQVDGHFYYLSPANIFNMDLKLPTLRKLPFSRAVNVLHAESYSELINLVKELEGGEWPSYLQLIFDNEALRKLG